MGILRLRPIKGGDLLIMGLLAGFAGSRVLRTRLDGVPEGCAIFRAPRDQQAYKGTKGTLNSLVIRARFLEMECSLRGIPGV